MSKLNLEHLPKKWVHSKEEDTETEMVYRPSTYSFPPVRGGRVSLDIKPDGTFYLQARLEQMIDKLKKKQTGKLMAALLY